MAPLSILEPVCLFRDEWRMRREESVIAMIGCARRICVYLLLLSSLRPRCGNVEQTMHEVLLGAYHKARKFFTHHLEIPFQNTAVVAVCGVEPSSMTEEPITGRTVDKDMCQ